MKNRNQVSLEKKKQLRQHRIKRFLTTKDDKNDEVIDHCTSYCETQDCDSKYSTQDQRVLVSEKMIKEVVYKADNYQRLSPRLMKSKKMGDIACKTLDTKKILNAIRAKNNSTDYFRMAKIMLKKSNQGFTKRNAKNLNLKIVGDRYSSIESLKSISEKYTKSSFISTGSGKSVNKEIEIVQK